MLPTTGEIDTLSWAEVPGGENSPNHITQFYTDQQKAAILFALAKDNPQVESASILEMPKFQAEVEIGAMLQTRRLAQAARASLYQQLESSATTQLYHYGEAEFESWEEMYEHVMADYDEDSTTRRDLRFAMERLGPVLKANGLENVLQNLIQPGRMAKFRMAIPTLRAYLGTDGVLPKPFPDIKQVIDDIQNETITKAKMIEKYVNSRNPSNLEPAEGQQRLSKEGGTLIIECTSVAQFNAIVNQIGGMVTWHQT